MICTPILRSTCWLVLLLCCLSYTIKLRAQLTVDPTPTPQQLVQNVLVGGGVTVSNVTYQGDSVQIGSFDATNANLMTMTDGMIMSSGDVTAAIGPNDDQSTTSFTGGVDGDADLEQANGGISVNDVSILEFDFVPSGDTVEFQYVFASDEYMQYANGSINDVFGFFISGPGINGPYSNNAENIATIPTTGDPVTLNNVNATTNPSFYVDNGDVDNGNPPPTPYSSDSTYIEYDGHTVVMTAKSAVQCDSTYHLKIAIADGSDDIIDSGVFLKGGSLFSDAIQVDVTSVSGDSTIVEACTDATFTLSRNDSVDRDTIRYDIGGDAVNGTDYAQIADSLVLDSGQASGSITIDALDDGVNETGLDTVTLTVYTINPCGDTIVNEASAYILDEYDVPLNMSSQTLPCPMDSVAVAAEADSGMPVFDYVWSDGTTGDTAYLPGTADDTLTVSVTDSCGMTGEDTAFVDHQWDSLSLNTTPDTVFGCYGNSSIDLNANVAGGQGPYSYDWSPGGGAGPSITVSPDSTTMYEVTVVDSCEADTLSDSVRVEVPLDPIDIEVNTVSADSSIVEGCTDGSFTFIRPDTAVFDTLEYTISGNAINGTDYASIGDSVVYNQGDTAASVLIDALVDGVTETSPDTLTLTTSFVDICGDTVTTQASMYIVEDYQVQALGTDTSVRCPVDSVPLHVEGQGGNTPYSYTWSDGTNDDSTFVPGDLTDTLTVTATDSCGQVSDPDTVVMDFQYDSLSLTTSNDTTLDCPGDTVYFSASLSGGHTGYSYNWSPGGSGPTQMEQPNNSTTYVVTATDSCGNESLTDSVQVSIPDPGSLEVSTNDTTVQCEGDSIRLIGSADSGYGGYSYDWVGGPSDSVWEKASFGDSAYVLQVTDNCGFTATDTSIVSHPDYDPLQVSTGPPDTACEDRAIPVDADASGGAGDYDYDWNGNGSIQVLQDGEASIAPSGGSFFTVTVTDACQNQAQDQIFLGVRDCQLKVPNVITPNGDGKNEAFKVENLKHYPDSKLLIYNRWGQKVYEDGNYQNDWEGSDLSEGTYYYVLKPGGEEKLNKLTGHLTLIRDKD